MTSRSRLGGLAAAGLVALLVLAYLWPALLAGRVLSPTPMLYWWAPWRALAPAGLAQYLNPDLADVPASYYPWNVLARQLIHAGTFPAWNPHAFAGTPFFANPELAWFSPFSLPLWILPLNYGLGLAAALKLWVAGFGTYLLARELRLGFWPALLAAVGFALCAFNVVWLSYGVFASVAALLPWAIWLVERVVRHGRPGDALALAVVLAVALVGGHPGTQLHLLAATVLYALVRAATGAAGAGAGRAELLRRLGLIAGALVVGGLVAAVTLLPAERAAAGTAGSAARHAGASDGFKGAQMPFGVLRTALFPDWWGRPSELHRGGPASYNERTFYAGAVVLVLAAIALVSGGAWRRKAPFVLLGALGAGVALRAPGLEAIVDHAPLFDRVQNQRMLLWFQFAAAVLAAFGLQAVLDAPRRQSRAWGVLAAATLAALIAGASLHLDAHTLHGALHELGHRTHAVTGTALALASVAWWLVFVVAVAVALLLVHLLPDRRRLVAGLVVLVAALDMLHFAHGFTAMAPPSIAIPPRTPAVAFLQRHRDDGRIAAINYALLGDWGTVYGLHDARGYDAPQPSLRLYHLWQAMNRDQGAHTLYLIPGIGPSSVRLMGLLGVRYIVANPSAEAVAEGQAERLATAYAGRDARIFASAVAVPRATVAARVRIAGSEQEEIAGVMEEAFDPRRDVVVRSDEIGTAPPRGTGGSARVIGEQNARVTLRASLREPGVVLLDDAWAPGWSVAVDGHAARPLQADVVLRGVVVPAGTHTIVWTFRVPGLRLGIALSALGLLALLAWGAWLVRAARRAPPRRAA